MELLRTSPKWSTKHQPQFWGTAFEHHEFVSAAFIFLGTGMFLATTSSEDGDTSTFKYMSILPVLAFEAYYLSRFFFFCFLFWGMVNLSPISQTQTEFLSC